MMEIKASVLEWLLELGIPEEDLPLSSYDPQSLTGSISLSEDAEAALLNGNGTWSIVSHVLKSRGKTLPFSESGSNPLKQGRTAIDRLHNWSFIERLLSTVGIIVDPDAKALAVAGDCEAVSSILGQIRDFCVPDSRREGVEAKLASVGDDVPLPEETYAEELDRAQIADEVSLALVPPASRYASDDLDAQPSPPSASAGPSDEARAIYRAHVGDGERSLEDSDSCAQFFIRSISKHFGTGHAESLKFLVDDAEIVEDWIIRGYPAGTFSPVVSWLNEIITRVTDLCFHIASEPATLTVSLGLVSTGVKSKNREVALTTLFLLKQCVAVLDKYYLWKASKRWLTTSVGALLPMVGLMRRFPDTEVSAAVCGVIRAFYREDFPQVFLPDVTALVRSFPERACFLRELTHALAADGSSETRVTNDSVSLLFQYLMEQLNRAQSDFEKNPVLDALAVCWDRFDITPNVEIRIKTILGHIQGQCRSPYPEVRHGALPYLFSLFEHLLRNGEDLASSCQQAVMTCYVENYTDAYVHRSVLKGLLRLLDTYDTMPIGLVISRLTSKVMEEGSISATQLRVLDRASAHPNLGIGDALSVFRFMLNLSGSQTPHAPSCMAIVLSLLDRVSEEEEAVAALRRHQDRYSGVRVRKGTKKADFLARIDLFLEQREDFNFVSRNLDQQFLATMEDAEAEVGSPRRPKPVLGEKENNYVSASPLAKRRAKAANPNSPAVGAASRGKATRVGGDGSKYNAQRGSRASDPRAKASAERERERIREGARGPAPKPKVAASGLGRRSDPAKNAKDTPKPKAKARSKEEVQRMKDRHRREIEEIRLRRERKQAAEREKEQERLDREERERQRHIQKRNRIVRNMAAPKPSRPAQSEDSEMISELVMEALKRRLDADPNTAMPSGYEKEVQPTYYSGLVDGHRSRGGEESAKNAEMCLSVLQDVLMEALQIEPKANLLGTIVVRRSVGDQGQTPRGARSSEPRSRGPASQPPARAKAAPRRKPPATSSAPPAKSARYYRRSPMYRPVLEFVSEMVHQAVRKVERKSRPKWRAKASSQAPAAGPALQRSEEDRLKYWNMRKQRESAEKAEEERKKAEAERAEQAKRKARADFLRKKLERQKQEKLAREREIVEEAKRKEAELQRQRREREEREGKRRAREKERLRQYREQKAKEHDLQQQQQQQPRSVKKKRKPKEEVVEEAKREEPEAEAEPKA